MPRFEIRRNRYRIYDRVRGAVGVPRPMKFAGVMDGYKRVRDEAKGWGAGGLRIATK